VKKLLGIITLFALVLLHVPRQWVHSHDEDVACGKQETIANSWEKSNHTSFTENCFSCDFDLGFFTPGVTLSLIGFNAKIPTRVLATYPLVFPCIHTLSPLRGPPSLV
jgi:hypothetical protein